VRCAVRSWIIRWRSQNEQKITTGMLFDLWNAGMLEVEDECAKLEQDRRWQTKGQLFIWECQWIPRQATWLSSKDFEGLRMPSTRSCCLPGASDEGCCQKRGPAPPVRVCLSLSLAAAFVHRCRACPPGLREGGKMGNAKQSRIVARRFLIQTTSHVKNLPTKEPSLW